MLYTTLNNGVQMPLVGFGVYQMQDLAECQKAVHSALMTGYRHIDTAAAYENESAVGAAIKQSEILRSELFITTKLWVQDAGYEKAKSAFYRSLERLQLDYLDLYLIHQPYSDVYGTWKAMEELYSEGLIRAIGVSNFSIEKLQDLILFNQIIPSVNQIETHPFTQQITTQEFLVNAGVQHESWAPFAEGKNEIFENPILKQIAAHHQKSIAQIILRWLIQRNIAVIPKSVNPHRIKENFDVFSFALSKEEMLMITSLDMGKNLIANHSDPARIQRISSTKFNT